MSTAWIFVGIEMNTLNIINCEMTYLDWSEKVYSVITEGFQYIRIDIHSTVLGLGSASDISNEVKRIGAKKVSMRA